LFENFIGLDQQITIADKTKALILFIPSEEYN